MINEINSQKSALKFDKNIPVSKTNTVQPAKPPPSLQNAVTRSAMSLAANAGLPADKLSASIVSFARFFSLPLKPNLLAAIRQQAFSQTGPQGAANNVSAGQSAAAGAPDLKSASDIMRARETLSLAAAAAESKGAELSQKGLETYAEAINPDLKRKDEDRQHDRKKKNQNEQAEKESLKVESITADRLKEMYLEYTEKNPLVEILNKLPGKNGQRWIVLPFDFFENEKHYKVSVRILLDEKNEPGCAVRMAIQAAVSNEKRTENNEQKWIFVLDYAENKIKAVVYIQNDMTVKEKERLKKELSEVLEIPVKSVYVKRGAARSEDNFPCEAGFDDQFPLIDEAV